MDSAQSGSLIITARCWYISHWRRHNPAGCGKYCGDEESHKYGSKTFQKSPGNHPLSCTEVQRLHLRSLSCCQCCRKQPEISTWRPSATGKVAKNRQTHPLCVYIKNSHNWGKEDMATPPASGAGGEGGRWRGGSEGGRRAGGRNVWHGKGRGLYLR